MSFRGRVAAHGRAGRLPLGAKGQTEGRCEDRNLSGGERGTFEKPFSSDFSRDDWIRKVRPRVISHMYAAPGRSPTSGRAYSKQHSPSASAGRKSTTGSTWAVLTARALPVGQRSERNLHRGLRSLPHLLSA